MMISTYGVLRWVSIPSIRLITYWVKDKGCFYLTLTYYLGDKASDCHMMTSIKIALILEHFTSFGWAVSKYVVVGLRCTICVHRDEKFHICVPSVY